MRMTLINCICFGFVGYIMAEMGHHPWDLQFWMVVIPMLIVQINNGWGR